MKNGFVSETLIYRVMMSDNQSCDIYSTIRSSSSSLVKAPSWSLGVGAVDDDILPHWPQAGASCFLANGSSNSARGSDDPNLHRTSSDVEHPVLYLHIPTVYLTRKDPSSSSFHVYQLVCKSDECEWSVYRRYSQFHALHQQLKALDAAIGRFHFPAKRQLNSKASTIVQNRRLKLEEYMRCLNNYIEKLPINSQNEGTTYQQLRDMLTVPGANSTTVTSTSSRITSTLSETSASSDQPCDPKTREDLSDAGRSSRLSHQSNRDSSCSSAEKETVRSLFHDFISLKEKKSEEFDAVNLSS